MVNETVLEYVKTLEQTVKSLGQEITELRKETERLEKLIDSYRGWLEESCSCKGE